MAVPFEASSLRPGLVVMGRYELVKELGRGGMGVVWLVHDRGLGIDAAFKFLPDVLRQDRSSLDELRDEARRNLRLTNESIVRIYDFVEDATFAGITMEYVDGETLASRKADAPNRILEVEQLWPLVRQLCKALHYAHTQPRVVHRDLKPANLMVTREGRLKITDFGIARSISDSVTRVSNAQPSSGTLVYMSPQQLMGESPKPSDDIYSIGATIYDLISGKPPFHTGSVAAQLLQSIPPPMAERRAQLERQGGEIPEAWEETVAACLSKNAEQRPETALEIIRLLEGSKSSRQLDPGETVFEPIIITPHTQKPSVPAPITAPPQPPIPVVHPRHAMPPPTPPIVVGRDLEPSTTLQQAPNLGAQSVPTAYPPPPGTTPPTASPSMPERSSGKGIWVATAILLIVLLASAVGIIGFLAKDYFAKVPSPTPRPEVVPTPVPSTEGRLIVNTLPSGARVWLDSRESGTTPLTMKNVAAGNHRIHFERDGYEPLDLEVEVMGGQSTDPGVLHLVPLPKKEPVPVVPKAPIAETNPSANVPAEQIGLSDAAASEVMVRLLAATENRDLGGMMSCYTNPVDYFDEGNLSSIKLTRSLRTYNEAWPFFDIQLLDSTIAPTADPDEKIVTANYRFLAKSGTKVSSGVAHDVMTIRRYTDGNFVRRIRQTVTERKKNF
jgi:serine/threonine protein kinase